MQSAVTAVSIAPESKTIQRERFQDYSNNCEKAQPTFSDAEMQRRQQSIRQHMADNDVDAVLFSCYHNNNYYSDFLFCQFGRRYGFVIDYRACHQYQCRY